MCDSLWPHGLQHTRLLCLPLSPGVCSNSCLLSRWCYLTILYSATTFSFCLLSQNVSQHQVFSSESALHIRWPKYWSFSFSTSLSYEYSWLISFRIDWFDLLVLQGTLKSLLQDRSSKTSILQCSAPFMEPGTKTLPQVLIWVSPCTTHIHFLCSIRCMEGFLDGSVDKDSSCNAVDLGLISGLRRSGGGNGNPLVFLPGESMDRGAWRATVQRVAKSWIQLTKHTQVHWGRGQERGWG